ncbi:MAG TPA: tetratricopeptide repeat protein [Candidatus Acidoferrum sp.]|nr:tetratricopeptide repeat protein [Candidatus Acidoferrum sp.]
MSRLRIITLVLALITLVAYLPAARYGFLTLDDDLYVRYNQVVQNGCTWRGVQWAFTTFHASNWHPVTWLSHMLDCELFGLNSRAHHTTSLLLHTANAVLLLALLWRLTRELWPSALAAALFAWHPLAVESAAWIAERKNVLSTFFGLLSLLAYVAYAQKRAGVPDSGGKPAVCSRRLAYVLALLCFALSLMSKPMLVTLPFVMLLLDYWPLGSLESKVSSLEPTPHATRNTPHALRSSLLDKLPFLLLVVPACWLTVLAQRAGGMVASLQGSPLALRLGNALRSYAVYLANVVWPAKLTILYPYPPRDQLVSAALAAAVLLLAVTWIVWRAHRRYPYLLVGWLWFLGTLVPAIGIVQVGQQAMNDHHAYVPMMGLFIAFAFGMKDLAARLHVGPFPCAAAASLLLGACLLTSEHQLSFWRDDEALFSHAVAVTRDNGPAHNHLGVALAQEGRAAEARAQFEEAIRLNPSWADPRNNLGDLERRSGDLQAALVQFSKAVQLKPGQPVMQENLGEVLAGLGRYDEALNHMRDAARLDPAYAWPHYQMARVLVRQGRDAEALSQCREALHINPRDPEVLLFTAHVLAAEQTAELRDGDAAVRLAIRGSALDPNDPRALDILGMAFAERGNYDEAEQAASNAVQLATALKAKDVAAYRQRLELYRQHHPWRESFTSGGGTD